MTTIGIIGAMQNEVERLVDFYNLKKDFNTKDIYYREINDKRIVVAQSGVGKVNSASMTQYIIDKYDVDVIINTGIAGGIKNTLKVMDIVISDYVTYHDFEPVSIMESYVPDKGKLQANSVLISLAKKVINDMNINNYHLGIICSGDKFVQDEKLKLNILLKTGAICVDMESASIAHVCRYNNVPFLSVRTISDMANGGEYYEDIAAYKSSEFTINLVNEIIEYLKKKNIKGEKVYLYVPNLDELDYYENLLNDPKTMSYNSGYNLNLDGYNNETGCINKFDKIRWYKRQSNDRNRFFAYVIDKENAKRVGYVNFHFDSENLKHSCGVVIEKKYRNLGYGTDALKELLKIAFKEYGLNSLINTIPYNRDDALKLFMNNNFKDIKKDYYLKRFDKNERIITLELTKEDYFKLNNN